MKNEKTDVEFFKIVKKKLKAGSVIKNYVELCVLLGIEPDGGNKKKNNIKRLERFCKVRREGHKFIIQEVYETPIGKAAKKSVYTTLFETLLLDIFIFEDATTIKITKNKLWQRLGLVNANFAKCEGNSMLKKHLQADKHVIANEWNVYQWQIDKAYQDARKKLNDITRSALKSLENRKLILTCDNVIMAKPTLLNKCIEVKNDETIEKILVCEKSAMYQLGFDSVSDVFLNHKMKEYFELRNEQLKKIGYDYVYRVYKIVCNRMFLKKAREDNILKLKKELNSKVLNYLFEKSSKDYAKNKAAAANWKYPKYFVELQKLIFTVLLDLNEKEIAGFIKSMELNSINDIDLQLQC